MLWRALSVKMWGLGLGLIVGLGVAFYLVLGQGTKASVTGSLLRREQTLARAQASNITSFFQTFGNSLAVFAQLSSMQRRDSATLQDMAVFVEQWRESNLVGGVVLTDRQGTVQLNANVLGTSDVGASLADRDYFEWAKNQPETGGYFVGQPVVSRLGASKGQLIVPVAAAVYREDAFVGALSASVKLKPLTERYLTLMKVADVTDVYLVDDQGQLLYSRVASDAVGRSIFELLPELKQVLPNANEEGRLQTEADLIAYAPILLGSQKWWLVVVTPDQNVADLAAPIYMRQVMILVFESLTILLFGIMVARDKRLQKTL